MIAEPPVVLAVVSHATEPVNVTTVLYSLPPILVLGGDQRRTWHRPVRDIPWGQRPAAGANQRVLQRGIRLAALC